MTQFFIFVMLIDAKIAQMFFSAASWVASGIMQDQGWTLW